MKRVKYVALTTISVLGAAVLVGHSGTRVQAMDIPDGMPTQTTVDLAHDQEGSTGGAGWGDMAGGNAARPYVVSLDVINGDTTTHVITDGTTTPATVSTGGVTTVVNPLNLCRSDQTPAQGVCYATPNRVGLTIGYAGADPVGSMGYNFDSPSETVSPTVDSDTVFDMTVALNTLGTSLRWSWMNGDLLFWQTSNLGESNATVHVKFKAASAPYVESFPDGSGCTATPIRDCNIENANGEYFGASMVFSLDDTLDPALTGAVFATQDAIAGFLEPGGTTSAPTLGLDVSSTHEKVDSSPQSGTLEAFIPSAALLNLYGILPSDAATTFATTRTGDSGTNDAPTYAEWTTGTEGADGLFVKVTGITFSVPIYQVAGTLTPLTATGIAGSSSTTITASITGCSTPGTCTADVYDLGPETEGRYAASTTAVATDVAVGDALSVTISAAQLPAGDRYLLVVRSTALAPGVQQMAPGTRVIYSTNGVVAAAATVPVPDTGAHL